MLPRAPAPRRRNAPADGSSHRFSPLNAPQRAVVDAFCEQSRPWAIRQAARKYRHLPEELREQAVDQAMRELRTGAPAAVDRRTLHAELAEALTEALRRVHVGWCLNQSSELWRGTADVAPPAPPVEARQALAGFVEDGLGGLERAVLQLEIGAGRDTRTVRAALRLGPRQYAHHREQGLSKLRDALTGSVSGQVCDHHLHAVVLAATGDGAAADALAGGAGRCRSCSREAQGLRRLLHERLALAPWPFVIKPASVIAVKVAAIGAAGKSASGGGILAGASAGSAGSAAIPTVLVVAALATGGGAVLGPDGDAERAASAAPAAASAKERGTASEQSARGQFADAKLAIARQERRARRQRAAKDRSAVFAGTGGPVRTPARTTAPASVGARGGTTTTAAASPATTAPSGPAGGVLETVGDAAGRVTKPVLPSQVTAPVDEAVGAVRDTVDQVDGTLGSLLEP